MKPYYVMWTYIANFSALTEVMAESPEKAIEALVGFYGPDFRAKATVFVFDKLPVAIRVSPMQARTDDTAGKNVRLAMVNRRKVKLLE